MRLLWADLESFRNLESQKVTLHPRFNLVLGGNGQGKTNFLEALGYLGVLRSFRAAARSDMIRRGRQGCRIAGEVEEGGVRHTLEAALGARGRSLRVDERPVAGPDRYLGILKVESFVPEDVGLVGGAPASRRRALDRAVFGTVGSYAREYRRYLHVLRQKNALLRQRGYSAAEGEAWSRELCASGALLVWRRCRLIEQVNPHMRALGARLGVGRGLSLSYEASFTADEDAARHDLSTAALEAIEGMLAAGVGRARGKEAAAGHSLVGPHRDDVSFILEDEEGKEEPVDLGRYGSQGQKRAAVLAFKLAVAETIRSSAGGFPVVLLDDVASELDGPRREALGGIVRGMEAQFFITTTGDDYMFLPAGEGSIWRMTGGRLERLSGA